MTLLRMSVFSVVVFLLSGCGAKSTSDTFFYIPWPSDTRLIDGGNVLASGQVKSYEYPGAESIATLNPYHLFANHVLYRQGARKMEDPYFGVNSATFFTFEKPISNSGLSIDPLFTQQPESPIQLVNVDETSERYYEQVPLMLDFKATGTLQRPSNVLSLLPYPGFTLAYHSRYAAVVFSEIGGVPKQLYKDIDSPWDKSMLISKPQHDQWQKDKGLVEDYVASIGRSMTEVAAYTVFSTQDPASTTLALRDALHTLDDDDIQRMVVFDDVDTSKNPTLGLESCLSNPNHWVTLTMHLRLPRWQKGTFPYMLLDGSTQFAMRNGKVQIPRDHEVVLTKVAVPCDASEGGNAYIVGQAGNNSYASSSVSDATYPLSRAASGPSDVLVIGVGDLISGPERRTDPAVQKALALVRTVVESGGFEDREILPAIRNGYFNPVAARGNMRQAAAEAYLLKRIAENLVVIAENTLSADALASSGLTLSNFAVDKDNRVGLVGFSQGANNSMVNMAMDEHYDFAYVGSGAGIDLPLVADKPPVKALLRVIFPNLEVGELDLFHPIGSFVQMAFEAMDSSNYVPYVNPTNLFITAGAYDTNVPPLASEHMAIALARRGLMGATAGGQCKLLDVDSFTDLLQMDPLTEFPISGNILSGKGTGVYSYGAHNHSACGDVGGFLYSATRGGAAILKNPC
ncbi:hypothetical protein A9Q99_19575 [Gammaproteobacteria bacterium 45_16_T64]|nr:hypothetical protein A9Q99_19575 [Gammaproteobacteria bacterium 45_16_T64]